MQQTGTLKKRRRRNLAKVTGLTNIQYDETEDSFTGSNLFLASPQSPKSFSISNGNDTRLKFSSKLMLDYRRESRGTSVSRTRVTRDPNYHDNILIDEEYPNKSNDLGNVDEESKFGSAANSAKLDPLKKRVNFTESLQQRTHFLDKYTMQRLKQLLWLGITSGAFPWTWNEKEHQIERWDPVMEERWTVQWFVVSVQTASIAVFQLYSFVHSFSTANKSYREVFMSSFSLLWYTWAVYFNVNMYIYKESMRKYINTMLNFNQKFMQKFVIHLDDYEDGGRLVINLAILSNISQVFVSVSLFLVMPYRPWYLFSFIYPKPWYWLIPGAIQEFLVVGQVITSYMLIAWIVVAHTNTLQFWLSEMHNHNDSDYTIDELRQPKTSIETYKALLILNQCFNDCMAPLAIPLVIIHMSSAMITCGYVMIRSMNLIFVDEFPGILTYPIGVLDCATAGFVIISMAAEVFDLGCSYIDSWSRTRHKDFRRILMSCPTIKIWVGRFYFMTVSTTITFFKFIFDYIIHCIITFP